MTIVTVYLPVEEGAALREAAKQEKIKPRLYARRILIDELVKRGLLAKNENHDPRQAHTADPRGTKPL